MLDKLALSSLEVVTPQMALQKLDGIYTQYRTLPQSKFYRNGIVFHFIDHRGHSKQLLALESSPKLSAKPTRVVLNPASFRSFRELSGVLERVLNLDQLNVTRIDHTVDVQVPVKLLFDSIALTRKRLRTDYRQSELTGFYLGKHPEQLCVYDKAKQSKLSSLLTRVEMRQWAIKVPIKKFLNLPELVEYNPYESLKVLRIKQGKTPEKVMQKSNLLSAYIEDFGLQGAIKHLNSHSNFKKVFGGCLEESPEVPDLSLIYRKSISDYMKHGGSYV